MDNQKRCKEGVKVGIVGIILNLILGIIKIILGICVNSISILADAFNNLTDMTSSILTIVGFKLSNKKPTQTHPYGYARYEYISGLLISVFMVIMSSIFVIESLIKVINPEKILINKMIYIILFITLLIKIIQMLYYLKMTKKISSISLKATTIETRNDIITNISILISMYIMNIYNINIDGLIGLIVSLILVLSSIKMFKETVYPLIGIVPNEEKIKNIENILLSYKQVQGIHDLMIHNYGVGIDYITVHIEIESNLSIIEMQKLTNKIEKDFKKNDLNINIHVDPIKKNQVNKKWLTKQFKRV